MARPLLSSWRPSMQHMLCSLPAALTSNFLAFTVIFTVFSAVIFMCGGHAGLMNSVMGKEKRKTVRLGGEKKKKMIKSSFSSKALLMISWRKVDNDNDNDQQVDDDQDGVVWKKTIIKGEKCRPLDFSGKILYDAHGNLLSD